MDELAKLTKLDPVDFEKFVGALFERMGYSVSTTAISGDEGIDLWIEKDGERSIVQCKRYANGNQVGQPVVRDLYGEMVHCQINHAFLVTTSTFSLPAQTWAIGKPIHLVDGEQLCDWMGLIVPPPMPEKKAVFPVNKNSNRPKSIIVIAISAIILLAILLILYDRFLDAVLAFSSAVGQ